MSKALQSLCLAIKCRQAYNMPVLNAMGIWCYNEVCGIVPITIGNLVGHHGHQITHAECDNHDRMPTTCQVWQQQSFFILVGFALHCWLQAYKLELPASIHIMYVYAVNHHTQYVIREYLTV